MPGAHALLSASASHRWLHCPPSVRFTEHLPDRSSIYADEGTLAHAYCARGLKHYLRQDASEEAREIEEYRKHYTDEMPGHVATYVDYVKASYERMRGYGKAKLLVEERTDYGRWAREGYGTTDAAVLTYGLLHIIDFKYGKGVRVEAEENPQLKLYALGLLNRYGKAYGISWVILTIVQPRLSHLSEWGLPVRELTRWGRETVRPRAEEAWEGKGSYSRGEWCRFCKGKNLCPESDASRLLAGYQGLSAASAAAQ